MHEALHDALQPAIVRWTMGGAAAPLAPEELKGMLGDDPDEAELRLLVVAGQALGMLVVPEPAGDLQGLPELPELSLPIMPDRLRPLAARVLARNDVWIRMGVLKLLEARGHVVHPGDWMPSRTGEAPVIYAPWQDWLAGISVDASTGRDPALLWDDLGTAGRRALLARLRRDDPAAGLALVAARAPGEAAEQRLWMVEALGTGLDQRDRTFLEGLAGDRAMKVRAVAARLLMRLGSIPAAPAGEDDPAKELTDFIHVETRGILRRERVIVLKRMRNQAQANRRASVFAALDAGTFARTLSLQDVEVPVLWPWGEDALADRSVTDLLLGTGRQEVVDAFERAVEEGAKVDIFAIMESMDRLAPAAIATIAARAYAGGQHLASIVTCLPTGGIIDEYEASPHWRSLLLQILRQEDLQPTTGTNELLALGVLVTSRAAREMLEKLTRGGIPSADPRLDALRINAAL